MSQTLGPYRLLSELGAGGFGQVHLALDPEGHTVAVKLLHPQVASDAGALARLAREVETMRLVRGPHIAEVLDASLDGARPYVVTRYIQGKPLSALSVPVADLARLARGLASALLAMHRAGVVHRDLKPANVMVSDGDPVVIDFGIARAFDSLSATAPGAVIGTPGYLAPEVIEGRPAAAPADVFSFGATVAYAATGRQPFGDGPLSAVAYRVVHHEPDLDGMPDWLVPIVAECLRRDPATRPTATEICSRLGVPDSLGPASPGSFGAPPFGAGSHGAGPYGAGSHGASPLGPGSHSAGSHGTGSHGASPLGAGSHGTGSLGAGPLGAGSSGASSIGGGAFGAAASPGGAVPPGDAPPYGTGSSGWPRGVGGAASPYGGRQVEGGGPVHHEPTRVSPARRPVRSLGDAQVRHREKVRRIWVIGSGLFVSLMAAATWTPLPELALFLIAAYSLPVLADAAVAVFSKAPLRRPRIVIDLSSVFGTASLWLIMSTIFEPWTLALFAITALVVGVVFLLSA